MCGTDTEDFQQAYCMEECAVKCSPLVYELNYFLDNSSQGRTLKNQSQFPITSHVI